MATMRIAIAGDWNLAFPPHASTGPAFSHFAQALARSLSVEWLPTPALTEAGWERRLSGYTGLLIAPRSPYRSMRGVLNAICWAGENDMPLIGTCGGFQHIVVEYARNVLGIAGAQHAEYDSSAPNLLISSLGCQLAG